MSTRIEWCDETWNPITGCTPISEGCQHCYARAMAKRFDRWDGFRPGMEHPQAWGKPGKWKKPRRVFVCSMGDLFHEKTEARLIMDVFNEIDRAPQHTYLMLTKRPWYANDWHNDIAIRKNAMLGVSAENQLWADRRLPSHCVSFVSVEPMLGPVVLPEWSLDNLRWVICGSENGPGARPMDLDWVRSLRDQCVDASVPFFYKGNRRDRVLDGREWNEFPEVSL